MSDKKKAGEADAARQEPGGIVYELYDWAETLVSVLVVIVLLFAFVGCVFSVDGKSMENTLLPGEMMMVSNLFYTPAHGDIVLFTKYGVAEGYNAEMDSYNPFVKRVIGLPGDIIEYDGETNTLIRNGERLTEPYLKEAMRDVSRQDMQGALVVPEGYLFVCGDNRNISLDSRSNDVGLVDRRYLLGRLLLRVTPLSKFGTVA